MDSFRAEISALFREYGRLPAADLERLLSRSRDQGYEEAWFWAQVEQVLHADDDLASKRRLVIAAKNRAQLLGSDFDVDAEVEKLRDRAESLGWSPAHLRRIFEQLQREVAEGRSSAKSVSEPRRSARPEQRWPIPSWRIRSWPSKALIGLAFIIAAIALVQWLRSPEDVEPDSRESQRVAYGQVESLIDRLEYAATFDGAVDTETMRMIRRIQSSDEQVPVDAGELAALRATLSAAEPAVWRYVSGAASIEAVTEFISAFPDGRFAMEAAALVDALREDRERAERISLAQRALKRLGRQVQVTGSLDESTREQIAAFRDAIGERGAVSVTPDLVRRLQSADRWPYGPGEVFVDCEVCPEMVVIPAGSFRMGSPPGVAGSEPNEQPVHEVDIRRFALARSELTFDQWSACVEDGGCDFVPQDEGWGRGQRPVVNVSWSDALTYLRWLSRKTGSDYRLPTEAEWEYAARAGTSTRFHTGSCITSEQANFDGRRPIADCPSSQARRQTLPVASFNGNAFGLFDMHGNVREWTRDCWNDNYRGAPTDGSAWMSGDCSRPVIRGGSWRGSERAVRSANRTRPSGAFTDGETGFRPALDLENSADRP